MCHWPAVVRALSRCPAGRLVSNAHNEGAPAASLILLALLFQARALTGVHRFCIVTRSWAVRRPSTQSQQGEGKCAEQSDRIGMFTQDQQEWSQVELSLTSQGPASCHKDRLRVLPPHKGHYLPAPGSLVMAWPAGAYIHPGRAHSYPALQARAGQQLHSCLRLHLDVQGSCSPG